MTEKFDSLIKRMIDHINANEFLYEEFDPLDAGIREITAEELIEYANAVIERKNTKVSDLDPKELRKFKSEKMKDYLQKPYIHNKLLQNTILSKITVETPDKNVDLEEFRKLVTERPKKLISQNGKMIKSKNYESIFFNTTLPALKGLVVDETTGKFYIVNTCPKAGSCTIDCYAKKGFYVIYTNAVLNQHKILNYLFNDKQGYIDEMIHSINGLKYEARKKNIQNIELRWNDSGDIFSEKYFGIVVDIARQTPSVNHYLYTKSVSIIKNFVKNNANNIPDNLFYRFSFGADLREEKNIDETIDYISRIVDTSKRGGPTLAEISSKKYIVKDQANDKWIYKDEQKTKELIAKRYNLNINSVLTVDEINEIPRPKRGENDQKYNVIILPGESDAPASRYDVHGIYLIKH
jgi:hypothetical protein